MDYNAEAMGIGQTSGRYPCYLRARYGDVATLSRAYGTAHAAFEDVPAPSSLTQLPHIRRAKDYFGFYLGKVFVSLEMLCLMEFPPTVILSRNTRGWLRLSVRATAALLTSEAWHFTR